jgi:hypothetical protein
MKIIIKETPASEPAHETETPSDRYLLQAQQSSLIIFKRFLLLLLLIDLYKLNPSLGLCSPYT